MKRCFFNFRGTAIATLAATLLGWQTLAAEPSGDWDLDGIREKGKEIVKSAAATLSSNLMQAVTQGGFTNAIEFCSVHAVPLTSAAVTNEPVLLRRVSFQTRNPENKPDQIEGKFLKQFAEEIRQGRVPVPQVETTKDRARYFEPIVINNPLCLNCHGTPQTQVKQDTIRIINKLYPMDGATGYKMGDLRGMWSVTFQPKPPGKKTSAR